MRQFSGIVLALLLISFALPSACGAPTQFRDDVPLGEPFWVNVGSLAVLGDLPTVIRFKRVVNDSRCPTDGRIVCVTAGSAQLEFTIAGARGDESVFELSIGEHGPSVIVRQGLRIELLDLTPAARTAPPIEPGEYRARLVVSRPD